MIDLIGRVILIFGRSINYESLRVVPSRKARTPAKITIKNAIPARSGEFIPRPEEKSILDKSKVL